MKKFAFIFILLVVSKHVFSQELDVFTTSYQVSSSTDHDLKISETTLNLGYPVLKNLRPDDFVLAQVQYKGTDFNSSSRVFELSPQKLTLSLGYLLQFEKVSLIAIAQGYYGSMSSRLTDSELLFNGNAVLRYKFSDRLTIGGGFQYSQIHDKRRGNIILPLVFVSYLISDKVTLNAFLPSSGDIRYRMTKTVQVGAGIKGFFDSYRFSEESTQNISLPESDNQTITGVNLYFLADFYITKNIALSFRPGLIGFYNVIVNDKNGNQINRNMGVIDNGIENPFDRDSDTAEGLNPNFYIEAGFSFRVDPNKLMKSRP